MGAVVTDRRTSELGLYDRTKCDLSDTTNTEVDYIHPSANARKQLRRPDRIVSGGTDCAICKRVVAAFGTNQNANEYGTAERFMQFYPRAV